ncbi:trfA family protein [Piscirickettsia litoralis]|nr:trfA family protein [Piscirickettsia litoralis]
MTATDHYNIKVSGEQLDQHDMAVLFSAFLAKDNNQSYNQELVVSLQQILRGLNTTDGSSQRRAINNSFQRFTEVTFDIVFGQEQFSTKQLSEFSYSAKTKAFTLSFSDEYAKLCAIDTLTTINIKERNSLPQGLTSWLYGYWSTFNQLPPLQIDELYKLCGSASSNTSTFKRSLTMALSTLENIGFIQPNWSISKPGFIFASKTTTTAITDSLPKTEEEIIA